MHLYITKNTFVRFCWYMSCSKQLPSALCTQASLGKQGSSHLVKDCMGQEKELIYQTSVHDSQCNTQRHVHRNVYGHIWRGAYTHTHQEAPSRLRRSAKQLSQDLITTFLISSDEPRAQRSKLHRPRKSAGIQSTGRTDHRDCWGKWLDINTV